MPLQSSEVEKVIGKINEVKGKEDVIEFLGEDDEKEETLDLTPKKKADSKKEDEEESEEKVETKDDEKEDEEDELKEIEEELEEPDEEKLELVTPVPRREILAKYPSLFKDFPYLEAAYYRERQFSEHFTTPDEAKEAAEKAQTLDGFESQIMTGSTVELLEAIKAEDANVFNKVVDNYLPTLMQVDKDAYYHVISSVIKDAVVSAVKKAQETGDEELQKTAADFYKFIFGTTKYIPNKRLSKETTESSEAEEKLKQKEQEILTKQFEHTQEQLQTKVDKILKGTIAGYIDPKNSMTDYVKKNATREAYENLEKLISKDTRFRALLNKLWEKSYADGFSSDSADRIYRAYLTKAKTLLPPVIKKARNDALRGLGKRVKDDEAEEQEETNNDKNTEKRESASPKSGRIKSAKDMPRSMRTVDYFMQD